MEGKVGGGRKSGSSSKLSKWVQVWDLQMCSSYLILLFAILVTLFCFVYFDILEFTPSGGLLLNISALRSFSHPTHHNPSSTTHNHHPTPPDLPSSLPPSNPPLISLHSSNDPFLAPTDHPLVISLVPSTHPIVDLSLPSPPPTYPIGESISPSSIQPAKAAGARGEQVSQDLLPKGATRGRSGGREKELGKGEESEEKKGNGEGRREESEKEGEGEGEGEEEVEVYERRRARKGECNLYEGRWVRDERYPLYRSQDCSFIDGGFRCQENGRPDADYLKWRWQPSNCNMPRFNGEDMLNRLRGARLVFVGDSIGRNQWESLLCMLAGAVKNKTRIYEKNGEPITKHKGFLVFMFEAYNCSIEYYRSPFLVPQGRPPRNHPEGVKTTLKVDTMDWTSNLWLGADIIVFNAGHWWSFEKTIRGGCYFQVGNNVNTSMSVRDGFGRAMRTWRQWVTSNINPLKTQLFFRTYAPVHFSGGTWKTGGKCNDQKEPYEEGTKFSGEPWTNGVVISETKKVEDLTTLLDITHLSTYRKDAHASIYFVGSAETRPYNHQDCSHWCLPGLPDTWNELLYASLLQAGRGSWHSH